MKRIINIKAKKGAVIELTERETVNGTIYYGKYTASSRVKWPESFYFNSEARQVEWAKNIVRNITQNEKEKAERRAKNNIRELEVGDVLMCSWGYDQTNIEYYEVIKLVGKTQVIIREIAQERSHDNYMQGECAPMVGEYIGEEMKRKAQGTKVKISDCQRAYKMTPISETNGVKVFNKSRWTAYA